MFHLRVAPALVLSIALVGGCTSELDAKPAAEVRDAVKGGSSAEVAKTLALDSAKSSVEFVGAKVTADHRGRFDAPTGKLELSGDGKVVGMEVTVKTDSLEIEPPKLADHLRDEDFFDVAKFPTSTFTLTSAEARDGGDATHQVTGNLDLHGVEKSITFPAKIEVGDGSAKATASFKINRKDFGITYAGMAEDLIKDDVLLEMSFAFAAG